MLKNLEKELEEIKIKRKVWYIKIKSAIQVLESLIDTQEKDNVELVREVEEAWSRLKQLLEPSRYSGEESYLDLVSRTEGLKKHIEELRKIESRTKKT